MFGRERWLFRFPNGVADIEVSSDAGALSSPPMLAREMQSIEIADHLNCRPTRVASEQRTSVWVVRTTHQFVPNTHLSGDRVKQDLIEFDSQHPHGLESLARLTRPKRSGYPMIAPLNVIALNSNNVGLQISTVKSLLDALEVMRQHGCGKYIVYSQKTGRRRFYEVTAERDIVFLEREELTIPGR